MPQERRPDADDPAQVIADAERALLAGGWSGSSAADARARAHGDAVVVAAVLEEGLGGRRQEYLEEQLIKYAIPVLTQLITTGRIIGQCHRLGRSAVVEDAARLSRLQVETCQDLVHDLVAAGLPVFRHKVFISRTWSPRGSASLTTYFVNACVLQFPGKFGRWDRLRRRESPTGSDDLDAMRETLVTTEAAGTEAQVINRSEAQEILDGITDDTTRDLLKLMGEGFSQAEAARHLGLTPKAAESRIGRARKRLRERDRRRGQEGGLPQ